MEIYGLVLASGLSRRMGKQKLLLPLGKGTILEETLKKTKSSRLKDIYAVIPKNDNFRKDVTLRCNVWTVLNPNPDEGMGTSLAIGIKHLPTTADAVVIMLADQPEIFIEDINRVYEYFSTHSYSKKMIVQTMYKDGRKGHPILFSKAFFRELTELTGDVGGKEIIRKNSKFVFTVKSPNCYPRDIDTPEDYKKLIASRVMD